jgi:hypothetical protein
MKNTFLVLALSVSFLKGAQAQQDLTILSDDFPIEQETTHFTIPKLDADNSTISAGISFAAMQNFKKKFPEVNSQVWYKVADGGYIASFTNNSVQTSVAYDKKGKWHHTINNYKEDKMAEDVWENIKNSYGTYEILKVSEVYFDNEMVYMILIQNKYNIKMIRIHEGNMEEAEHYKRLN